MKNNTKQHRVQTEKYENHFSIKWTAQTVLTLIEQRHYNRPIKMFYSSFNSSRNETHSVTIIHPISY